jgi:predicted Fe-Mo cluster-binding NifX family protein
LFNPRACAAAEDQGEPEPESSAEPRRGEGSSLPDTSERLLFAVASKNGIAVDQHFGHVTGFYIYEYKNRRVSFVERREVSQYCFGSDNCGRDHEDAIDSIIKTIEGCSGVIVLRIGDAPRRLLAEKGISVFMNYNYVTDAVREAAEKELRTRAGPK